MSSEPTEASLLKTIQSSLAKVDGGVQSLLDLPQEDFDFEDGISLLTLKNRHMTIYLTSLLLVLSNQLSGESLEKRSPPTESFEAPDRAARGNGGGDAVDQAIESRMILEQCFTLQTRLQYQIDKLTQRASQKPLTQEEIASDPLSFKPQLSNLVAPAQATSWASKRAMRRADSEESETEIYRPPKVAPVPYVDPSASRTRKRSEPGPSALTSLADLDPSLPFVETTSGLGGGSANKSSATRSRLDDMTRYEEENMTRLLMNKKEAKKRRLDEGNVALGGMGGSRHRNDLHDEFSDIFKSVGRSRQASIGDGYEALRVRDKKQDAFARSKARAFSNAEEPEEEGGAYMRKKRSTGGFAKDLRKMRKKREK